MDKSHANRIFHFKISSLEQEASKIKEANQYFYGEDNRKTKELKEEF